MAVAETETRAPSAFLDGPARHLTAELVDQEPRRQFVELDDWNRRIFIVPSDPYEWWGLGFEAAMIGALGVLFACLAMVLA